MERRDVSEGDETCDCNMVPGLHDRTVLIICTEVLPVNVSDFSDLISMITNSIKDPRYSLTLYSGDNCKKVH